MSHIWLATDAQEGGRDTNAASQLGEARGGDEAPNVDEMDRKSPASASLSHSWQYGNYPNSKVPGSIPVIGKFYLTFIACQMYVPI